MIFSKKRQKSKKITHSLVLTKKGERTKEFDEIDIKLIKKFHSNCLF